MPLDPLSANIVLGQSNPLAALRQELSDLTRRIRALESTPTIAVIDGTPTAPARDGTPALDSVASKLWVRRNGAWQFTTLT